MNIGRKIVIVFTLITIIFLVIFFSIPTFLRRKLIISFEVIDSSSENFIKNPGFEEGFNNWIIEVNKSYVAYISSKRHGSGNFSLYVEVLNDWRRNLNNWVFRIRQYVDCNLSTVNYFSFDIKIVDFSSLGNPNALGYVKAHIGLLIDNNMYDVRVGVVVRENELKFIAFFPRRIDIEEGVIYNLTRHPFLKNKWITVSLNLSKMFDEYRDIKVKYILFYVLTRNGCLKTYIDNFKLIDFSSYYPKILLKIMNPNSFPRKICRILIDNRTVNLERVVLSGYGYYNVTERNIVVDSGGEVFLKIFLPVNMTIRKIFIECLDGEKYVIDLNVNCFT